MRENTIQLKEKENILKLEIVDELGNSTGEYLEFDLDDIELPLIYQELVEKDKKNKQNLRNQLLIIEKKEDHKGKKLLSANEEAKLKAIKEFFDKEVEVYDMFLGKDGVKKLLNGRKIGWETLKEIDEIITTYISPQLDLTMDNITKKIRSKYNNIEEGKVIE